MRIAIDVRSLMEGRHSGVEEYTVQIIQAMMGSCAQHEYNLFYNSAKQVNLPWFDGKARVSSFRYPNKMFNALQWLASRPRWDKLVEADCFFVPNFRLMPLSLEVPLVTTVHDLSFEHFPEFFSWKRRLWHKLMRPRVLLMNSDHVIAVSEATKADVVNLYGVPADKVTVIYSGVSSLGFTPPLPSPSKGEGAKRKYNLPERFVLYLGTLEPRKNVGSIIRAYDAIAPDVDHDFVIAGSRGWLMGEIDEALQKARHKSRMHVVGFVAEEDKAAIMSAADLFVYPSLYEGFGFPPLEALLAGTPVITSFNSSLPEVVGEWATLVDPYDISELALMMKELLGDLPIVSEEDKQAIRQKYSWDRAARETLAIIERVV